MTDLGSPYGLLPRPEVLPWVIELVERCGSAYKAQERYGLCQETLLNILSGRSANVRVRTARRVRDALTEQRHWDESHPKPSAYQKRPEPLVLAEVVVASARELLQRCDGGHEVERRYGIPYSTVRHVANHHTPKVQRRTAQRILAALVEQRKLDRVNGHMSNGYRSKLITVAVRDKKMMDGYATT